jgi:small conductance mechanosensitive channel
MTWDWKKIYERVYDWLVIYGPKILVGIIVFIAGIFMIRVLNKWVKKGMEKRHINSSIRYFLQNLFAITLQVLLVMLVLQIIGLQLTLFSAIVAGLTVAAGLALSGTLQNFVSGILILVLKPYRVGDNISTAGQEGAVTSIQLFYTVILTFDNKTLIVPNGQLSNTVVMNLSKEGKRRLDIDIKFGYMSNIAEVREVLLKSIASVPGILPDPPPQVGVSLIDVERYTITINIWTQAHGFYDTRLAVNEKLINDLIAAGIKFTGMA